MINIASRKYFSEWGNGSSFASNLTDFAEHLKGSVGEKLKVVTRVKVALISRSTQQNPYEVINGNYLQRNDQGSFIQEGFAIGQACIFIKDYDGSSTGNSAAVEFSSTIVAISHSQIEFTSLAGVTKGEKTDHALVCISKMDALVYRFGIVENSAPENFNSPYSDDSQEYYFGAIDTTTPTEHTMIAAGGNSGSRSWKSGDATVQYISSSNDKGLASPTYDYIHEYEVTQIFVINPLFLESYLEALDAGIQPDDFVGSNSPRHVTEYEFRYTLTNPNTTVRISDTGMLGSVGWFGENYNGFNDIYSAVITDYRDTLTDSVVEGLQLKRKTTVSGVITGSGFTNTSKGGAYFFWGAPLGIYSAIQPSFQDTFLYDGKVATMSGGTVEVTGTDRIKRFQLNYSSATTLTFEMDIELSDAQALMINPELLESVSDKYFIGVQVGNTANVDTSNKVLVPLDWAEFVINNDVEGLATFSSGSFFDHGMDPIGQGHTDYKGWLQDGFAFSQVLTLNKALQANLKALQVRLIAYNTVTSEEFDLQSYQYDLSDIVDVPGTPYLYQQLVYASTRGFRLITDDPFDAVSLSFGVVVGTKQEVSFSLGMKFDWQSWILLEDADKIFFDNSLGSRGMGKDASRYSMNQDYEIRLVVDADIKQLTEVSTRYSDYSNYLKIYGWGLDGSDPANWTTLVQTFNEDEADLSGAILQNADTIFRATHTPLSGSTAGFDNKWAIHRIDQILANGYNTIGELSSFRDYPANNVLKPSPGQSFLKITDTGTEVITECLIDYTKLSGGNYDISARLSRDITHPRYSIARDMKYLALDKSEMIYFNCPDTGVAISNSLRWAQLDEDGNITSEVAIALSALYTYQNWKMQVAYDTISNGKPNFYAVTFTGAATELHEFIFNGTTYIQTRIFSTNLGGTGLTCIRIDPELEPDGFPFIYFGNRDANIGGERGFKTAYKVAGVWTFSDFMCYTTATPGNDEFAHPQDIIIDNANTYIQNYDNPPQTGQYNEGKIGMFAFTGLDITDPVQRSDFSNYTFVYNLYRNSGDTENVDGIGTVGDLSHAVGFELLEVDADSNPVFLIVHDASLGTTGARHFSRLYANDPAPAAPGDWTIQTPMAFTNESFGAPEALIGYASATEESSPLQRKNQCHILVVDANTIITGHQSAEYWTKLVISAWDGSERNHWHIYAPDDPGYAYSSGNILHE
jgi:hypothetical protein